MFDHMTISLAAGLALIAGLAMPLGAYLGLKSAGNRPKRTEAITAFGGGALISAVALVLVPEGAETLPTFVAVALFAAGGFAFMLVDVALEKSGGAGAQLLAMLLDYLPEAAALGAMLALHPPTAYLLALLIFLQNLPEGFSSFCELAHAKVLKTGHIVPLFLALALIGPVFAVLGLTLLSDRPAILGGIMIFAAGGILYVIFQDIAPAARDATDLSPPLGAVFGFALGLLGHLIVG